MSQKVILWSIVAALAGFLFGFDTAVISGAEKSIQQEFQTNDLVHGIAISAALWGTVIGALFGAIPNDKWGRKATLIGIGGLYLVSAILSAIAWDISSFTFARFIGGLGVGASTIAAPGYISEIAPDKHRGRLVVLYQLSLVVGIFAAFLSNFVIGGNTIDSWRWMLAAETVPAAAFFVLALLLPESPHWLVQFKKDIAAARSVLVRLGVNAENEIAKLKTESISADILSQKAGFLLAKSLRKPVLLAFLFGLFNQLSGINAIIYYAPRILEMTGSTGSGALLATVGIGLVNILFTLLGLYLIDKVGRKTLMIIGSIGYIVSLGLIAWNFHANSHTLTAFFIFAFIASHAIGQGAVIWVYIAEIFPTNRRSFGQSVGSSTHWVVAALLAFAMPPLLAEFSASSIFATFALFMVFQLLFAIKVMVETKSKSLVDIQMLLTRA